MKRTDKQTRALTAADVMNRTVVTVSCRMPLGLVARTFARTNALVLPVVDEQGKFVGAISAMEVHQWAAAGGHYDACASPDWRTMTPGTGRTDEVRWYLMKDPAVVAPETGVPELVKLLRKSRAVIVVDKQRRPVGKILAADLLAVADSFTSPLAEQPAASLSKADARVDSAAPYAVGVKPMASMS